MLRLRWQLAKIELAEDFGRAKRLLAVWLAAMVLLIGSLPVLVVAAAEGLAGTGGLSRVGWLLVFGGAMLFGSLAAAGVAWLWFRRRFNGLKETLAELEEDRLWLDEWRQAKQ